MSEPLKYGEILRFLESEEQVADVGRVNYQRNSDGSKLFIRFSFGNGNEEAYRTAIVTGTGIKVVPGYPAVWYDDLGNPALRFEGGNFIFTNGLTIPDSPSFSFRGVLGADYFLLRLTNNAAWIVSPFASVGRALFELPSGFEPHYSAYATSHELMIFGTCETPQEGNIMRCLIYEVSGVGSSLAEDIPIPWASYVEDMDASTGDALIRGNSRVFNTYYLFNIRTKHRKRLGLATAERSLFLKENVIRTLDAALHQKR